MLTSDEPAAVPFDVTDRDRDLMARTLYGEANGQGARGQAAVAQVIVNRTLADGYPGTVGGVVLQPGQFEPWAKRRGELLSLSPDSRAYREALQTVDDVLDGRVPDMTGGATHFYAPVAQRALGRPAPSWAKDPLAREGGHVFYAPNSKVDRGASVSLPASAGPAAWATLDEAGVMPLDAGTAPSKPKAATMPTKDTAAADDDALLSMYGIGAPAPAKAQAKPAATSAKAVEATPPARGALSDDALLGLYVDGAAPAAPAAPAGETQAKAAPPPLPLASPAGTVDGNTGELVVGGKGFTDNAATAGSLGGAVESFANGALLGAGVPIKAAAAAVKEKVLHGGDIADLYRQARSVYGGAQDQYRAANPGTALATELAGSIPSTIAATALGGAALGATGNALLDLTNGSRIAAPLAAAGRFVTGGAGQGGSLAARIGSRGVAGAAGGAFGGAINTGLSDGSIADNALAGATGGLVVGSALPAAGAVASGTLNRLTGAASPEAAALARTAQGYGIPVRAAEISDNALLRGADTALSKVPGMGYGAIDATKQAALNRAVAGQIGETADRITPTVMQAAKDRLGQSFERVAKDSYVRLDDGLADALTKTVADAGNVLTPSELTPLQNLVRKGILPKFGTVGEMEGDAYQAATRKGSPLSLMQEHDNGSVRHFANQIRSALDDALERSAPQELVDELRQTRGQYRAMKLLEPLVAANPSGNVDAAAFHAAVSKGTRGMAYGGGGDLADLARVAQTFGPQAQTATQQGQAAAGRFATARNLAQATGGLAAGAVGVDRFGPQLAALTNGMAGPALAGAAGTLAAGRVASSVLRSPALANRLIDRSLGTGQAGAVNRLLSLTAGAAPETVAPLYNRTASSTPAGNDNRLAAFLASRPRRAGGMLP